MMGKHYDLGDLLVLTAGAVRGLGDAYEAETERIAERLRLLYAQLNDGGYPERRIRQEIKSLRGRMVALKDAHITLREILDQARRAHLKNGRADLEIPGERLEIG